MPIRFLQVRRTCKGDDARFTRYIWQARALTVVANTTRWVRKPIGITLARLAYYIAPDFVLSYPVVDEADRWSVPLWTKQMRLAPGWDEQPSVARVYSAIPNSHPWVNFRTQVRWQSHPE